MRFAVCAEDEALREALASVVERCLERRCADAEVLRFAAARELLSGFVQRDVRVLVLDADCEGGMDCARSVRALDADCRIIICSADRRKALGAYAARPAAFLLRPFAAADLAESVERCSDAWRRSLRYIEVTSHRYRINIFLEDIDSIEVIGRVSMIRAGQMEYPVNSTLTELEQRLGGTPFLRCHNSFIVNLNSAEALERGGFRLRGGQTVPVGNTRRESSEQAWARHTAREAGIPGRI